MDAAMLELVNRMNENDDRKWVLVRHGISQAINPFYAEGAAAYANNQMANPLVQ